MSDNHTTPSWMDDELVRNIPKKKLEFLQEAFQKGHGKSQKEMMALLMPLMQRAKKEGLSFTPAEMNAAVSAIKKYSTEDEKKKIEEILKRGHGGK